MKIELNKKTILLATIFVGIIICAISIGMVSGIAGSMGFFGAALIVWGIIYLIALAENGGL